MNTQDDDKFEKLRDTRWKLQLLLCAFLVTLALLVAHSALAQTTCEWNADCISWSLPAKYVTGEPLDPASIDSYRLETAISASGPWTTLATVKAPTRTYKRQPVSGTNYYRVSVVLVSSVSSDPSVTGSSTTVEPKPELPVLQVVENTVYNTGSFDPSVWLVRRNKVYGTVPLGTACDETRPAKDGLYRVPVSLVTWANPRARTQYPLAKCERKA